MSRVRVMGLSAAFVVAAIVGGAFLDAVASAAAPSARATTPTAAADPSTAATAAGPGGRQPSEYCLAFRSALAANLGVTQDQLVAAAKKATGTVIDRAVADGKLRQAAAPIDRAPPSPAARTGLGRRMAAAARRPPPPAPPPPPAAATRTGSSANTEATGFRTWHRRRRGAGLHDPPATPAPTAGAGHGRGPRGRRRHGVRPPRPSGPSPAPPGARRVPRSAGGPLIGRQVRPATTAHTPAGSRPTARPRSTFEVGPRQASRGARLPAERTGPSRLPQSPALPAPAVAAG